MGVGTVVGLISNLICLTSTLNNCTSWFLNKIKNIKREIEDTRGHSKTLLGAVPSAPGAMCQEFRGMEPFSLLSHNSSISVSLPE